MGSRPTAPTTGEEPTISVLSAEQIIELLGLVPLTHEGGHYHRTYGDEQSTAIYFLLGPQDASALHRLPTPEIWHHYAGAAARLLVLAPGEAAIEHHLGDDLLAGQRPQVVVPAGAWQGAVSDGPFSLLGTTMAPPYDQAGFVLGDPTALAAQHPSAAALIARIAACSRHLLGDEG